MRWGRSADRPREKIEKEREALAGRVARLVSWRLR